MPLRVLISEGFHISKREFSIAELDFIKLIERKNIYIYLKDELHVFGFRKVSKTPFRLAKLFSACDHYFVDFDANHVTPLDPG